MVQFSAVIKPSDERISAAAVRITQPVPKGIPLPEADKAVDSIYHSDYCSELIRKAPFQAIWKRLAIEYGSKLQLPQYSGSMPDNKTIVDHSLPTLGCLLDGAYDALPQFAIAAQKRRESGLPSINVVFITKDEISNNAELVKFKHGAAAAVKFGIVVGQNGEWTEMKFNPPLIIDSLTAFAPSSGNLARELELKGVKIFNDSHCLNITSDKGLSLKFLQNCGLNTPQQVIFKKGNSEHEKIKVRDRLLDFFSNCVPSSFVIKPVSCSGGQGVNILENPYFKDLKQAAYQCFFKYGNCAVEQRIESFPLVSRLKSGDLARLDWNIRLLASKYGVIDMEARVHEWGKPVNVCLGAEVWEVKDVLKQLGSAAPTYEELLRGIEKDISIAARLLNGGLQGYDLILNPNGERYYIEVNAGMVGGFGSLFKLRNWRHEFDAASNAIELFTRDLSEIREQRGRIMEARTQLDSFTGESTDISLFKKRQAVLEILHTPEVRKLLCETQKCEPLDLAYAIENDWLSDSFPKVSKYKSNIYFALAECYEQLQSPEDVLRITGYMDLVSDQHDLHCISGNAYYDLGMKEEALEEFRRLTSSCRNLNLFSLIRASDLAIESTDYELAYKLCDLTAECFPHVINMVENTKTYLNNLQNLP